MARPNSTDEPSRRKQILVGAGVIGSVGLVLVIASLGRFLPGAVGEAFGLLSGIVSTPFLMEISLAGLGLLAVLIFNHFRQVREGDDYVYLEEVTGPEADKLPEQARWATYSEAPLESASLTLRDELEGCLAIDDWNRASELLADMNPQDLHHPDILELRLQLAEATQKSEQVAKIRALLASTKDLGKEPQ
ncbi:hypothetical protein HNR46_002241 [Haloferula luteola]|uniref:Uncharacterized protein n=1 Tax=Haloferula luteola TaxID=595692 RepID=A0A840VDP3_9BACT|nr:hypothetical protein [Haloferula luteola]MBB5352000.1 hypothetical protein [Haloferula luteola]